MILTSKIAKDIEAIIKKGLDYYNPDVMIRDIDAYVLRKRMTVEEGEYLKGLIEAQLNGRIEALTKDK